jgi:hypothetical protein
MKELFHIINQLNQLCVCVCVPNLDLLIHHCVVFKFNIMADIPLASEVFYVLNAVNSSESICRENHVFADKNLVIVARCVHSF